MLSLEDKIKVGNVPKFKRNWLGLFLPVLGIGSALVAGVSLAPNVQSIKESLVEELPTWSVNNNSKNIGEIYLHTYISELVTTTLVVHKDSITYTKTLPIISNCKRFKLGSTTLKVDDVHVSFTATCKFTGSSEYIEYIPTNKANAYLLKLFSTEDTIIFDDSKIDSSNFTEVKDNAEPTNII